MNKIPAKIFFLISKPLFYFSGLRFRAPVESKYLKDDHPICAICQDDLLDENASKACPHSDKHDFHKECLATYLDS